MAAVHVLLFDGGDLGDPIGVTAFRPRRGQPGIDDLQRQAGADEPGTQGEQVNVNVPLNIIRAFLPMVEELDVEDMMGLDLGNGEFEGLDLRAVLEALRDTPDSDFVTVRSDDENVRIYKEDGYIKVLAEEKNDSEKVRVMVPLDVLDALVSGPDGTLDLSAAIERLMAHGNGDLVTVESDDENVRIWIDFDASGSR